MENEKLAFPRLREVMEKYGQAVRNAYQDELIKGNRIASGELLNGMEFEVKVDGSVYEVGLDLAHYWKYLEEGVKGEERNTNAKYRNGGWGAYFPLMEWIRIKPVLPHPNKDGKLPTLKQLTGAITASYIKKGIRATHALDKVNKRMMEEMRTEITDAFTEDVAQNVDDFVRLIKLRQV